MKYLHPGLNIPTWFKYFALCVNAYTYTYVHRQASLSANFRQMYITENDDLSHLWTGIRHRSSIWWRPQMCDCHCLC